MLVTRWETPSGVAEVHDFMPVDADLHVAVDRTDIVRRIVGVSGSVEFEFDLRIRFDYGRAMPWVRKRTRGGISELTGMAGPDAVVLRGPALTAEGHRHTARVELRAGERIDSTMTWFPSFRSVPDGLDIDATLHSTMQWWRLWAERIEYDGPHAQHVVRSLLVLRALTNHDTGGIATAATTSLPEDFGGERNWDYRYVWLRDAAFTLEALVSHGFLKLADAWRTWLLRAVAGDPADLQIMYGLAGERNLPEYELEHLAGYADSRPVRVGNDAATQYQADVVGEVLVTLAAAREAGLQDSEFSWPLEKHLVRFAAEQFERPDNGIWEIRGESHHFTHSRVMMWGVIRSRCASRRVARARRAERAVAAPAASPSGGDRFAGNSTSRPLHPVLRHGRGGCLSLTAPASRLLRT